ncbi:MAG: methyltransferase domain-containing protein [bacterium]|nr:methyltransferase domain-containing protein [bacterium]
MIKENTFSPEEREKEPKQIIVEVGPGDRPLIYWLKSDGKEMKFKAGKDETLFSLKAGDKLVEVDLPGDRNVDLFRHVYKYNWEKVDKSHLLDLKKVLDKCLLKDIKGEILHADGQKLPLRDGQVDIVFMGNVISGHVKDDELLGFAAKQKHILREKENLIKEAKRVLRVGGKLIIQEEFAPAESVRGAYKKVLNNFDADSDFSTNEIEDFENSGGVVFELTKLRDSV